MEYKRDTKGISRRKKQNQIKKTLSSLPNKMRPVHWLLVLVAVLCGITALYFGTNVMSNPDVDVLSTDILVKRHIKNIVVAENSVEKQIEGEQETTSSINKPVTGATGNGKSGILFGDYPGELFAVSMTGEGSGAGAGLMGDRGRAYGLMQLDYRYALIPFCRWASAAYPELWGDLAKYTNVAAGSASLVNNQELLGIFEAARAKDNKLFLSSQCEYFKINFYDATYNKLKTQGVDLDERNIAVSAALLSLQVNCGSQTSKVCALLNSNMSDDEMIRTLYANRRNGHLKSSGASANRWKETNEVQQCLDMLSGGWNITQDYDRATAWSGGWFWSKLKPIYFD